MSQADLARATGLSKVAISRWRNIENESHAERAFAFLGQRKETPGLTSRDARRATLWATHHPPPATNQLRGLARPNPTTSRSAASAAISRKPRGRLVMKGSGVRVPASASTSAPFFPCIGLGPPTPGQGTDRHGRVDGVPPGPTAAIDRLVRTPAPGPPRGARRRGRPLRGCRSRAAPPASWPAGRRPGRCAG
jgi:hypothetical protein